MSKVLLLPNEESPSLWGIELEAQNPMENASGQFTSSGAKSWVTKNAPAFKKELEDYEVENGSASTSDAWSQVDGDNIPAAYEESVESDLNDALDHNTVMSVHSDGGGLEVAFMPASFKYIRKDGSPYKKAIAIFNKYKFIGDDSTMAGMHIHFDRSLFTADQFELFIIFLRENKVFLHTLSNRRERSSYTNVDTNVGKTNAGFTVSTAAEWKGHFDRKSAMYGNNCITLNPNGKGTVECRFFNSTLIEAKFFSNIELIHALVYFIKSKREKSLPEFFKYVLEYHKKYTNLITNDLIPMKFISKLEYGFKGKGNTEEESSRPSRTIGRRNIDGRRRYGHRRLSLQA